MKPLLFGEYRPDLSDLNSSFTGDILNVKPRADGYGPFPSLASFSEAVPGGPVVGGFYALNEDGTVTVFAGTATKLYKLDNTDLTWDDVSLGGGSYTAIASDANWSFTQFGKFVVAVHANIDPQVFELGVSSTFDDLAGSPPRAARASVIGYFLVLSGLPSNKRRVQWSGLGTIIIWDGTQSSGFQDMPSGGEVMAVEGSEYGVVVQENRLSRMVFNVGDPRIFTFTEIVFGVGTRLRSAITNANGVVYFPSSKGFVSVTAEGGWKLIGKERTDRTFLKAYDENAARLVVGVSVPNEPVIVWSYKSRVGGVAGQFDKLLAYDYALDKWYPASVSGQYLVAFAQPGITLDAMNFPLDSIDYSLDDVSATTLPKFGAFDTDAKLAFFQGPNLEAIIGTAESSGIKARSYCSGFWPITDAAALYGSVSGREGLQDAPAWNVELAREASGIVPADISTRHLRARIRIPAGTIWTYATGAGPELQADGEY